MAADATPAAGGPAKASAAAKKAAKARKRGSIERGPAATTAASPPTFGVGAGHGALRSERTAAQAQSAGGGASASIPLVGGAIAVVLVMLWLLRRRLRSRGWWTADRHRRALASPTMDLEEAIRSRRTHKVYGSEPVDRETLAELLELGRWAPNHHLTEPWRFRVLGPESLEALKEAAGPEDGAKLDRAPTLICASQKVSGDSVEREEDLLAVGCAVYAVLLAAHARGLVAYWRTPGTLRTPEGARAVGIGADEHFVGLIHMGPPRQAQPPPERAEPDHYVTFLP